MGGWEVNHHVSLPLAVSRLLDSPLSFCVIQYIPSAIPFR